MKKNILFLVEGKTEGCQTLWGRGLFNMLREEVLWMRQKKIFFGCPKVYNGKYDMMQNISFDIGQHLDPPNKLRKKREDKGKPLGDYAIILRDLDCEDETDVRNNFDKLLINYLGNYSIHFAVQEIEAWMVADPDAFRQIYKKNVAKIIDTVTQLSNNPEGLDCSPKVSERLKDSIRRDENKYRKTIEGPALLLHVNPIIVKEKCPHFKEVSNCLRKIIGMPI